MSQTYGEQFDSAMKCSNQEEAETWLRCEILTYKLDHGISEDEARKTILINLGYMAGYCDEAARRKMERLFGAEHPIIGNVR